MGTDPDWEQNVQSRSKLLWSKPLKEVSSLVAQKWMAFCRRSEFHPNTSSASQRTTRWFGPAPRAISSPALGQARKHPHRRHPRKSSWLHVMMQSHLRTTQWMTPARGNPLLDPPMMTSPRTQCKLTSHPRGCAVSTLLRSTANHSRASALCVWSSIREWPGDVHYVRIRAVASGRKWRG